MCICNLPNCKVPKWNKKLHDVTIENLIEESGPTLTISENRLEVFNLFFTDDLLVMETNKYAKEVLGDKSNTWTMTTIQEIRAHLRFQMLKGIKHLPSDDDYWKKDPHLYYHPIASRITRDRFKELGRYLHFVDNLSLPGRGDPHFDKLGKIRPIIDHLSKRFTLVYKPGQEVSVDETMIEFQGHSTLKQYMPTKPIEPGLKVWVLADSNNRYFCKFRIYTGNGDFNDDKILGKFVVHNLTSELRDKLNHVYFDNFFTSPNVY